jgi:hypothetical protein
MKGAAGYSSILQAPLAGSDFGIAGIVGILDAPIGEPTAQPVFGCPQVEGVASILHQDGPDNGVHEVLRV